MTLIIEHPDYEKAETNIEAGSQKNILLVRKAIPSKDRLTYPQALENIRAIFENYQTNEEAIETAENKQTMTHSLKSVQSVTDKNDLELLINVWNYYDPTDYSCRGEIYQILLRNRAMSMEAVKNRMKNRMSWESPDLSGTEFKHLLEKLEGEK